MQWHLGEALNDQAFSELVTTGVHQDVQAVPASHPQYIGLPESINQQRQVYVKPEAKAAWHVASIAFRVDNAGKVLHTAVLSCRIDTQSLILTHSSLFAVSKLVVFLLMMALLP